MNAYKEQEYVKELKKVKNTYPMAQLDEEIQRVENIISSALKEFECYIGKQGTYTTIFRKETRPIIITKIEWFSSEDVIVRIEYQDRPGFDNVYLKEVKLED